MPIGSLSLRIVSSPVRHRLNPLGIERQPVQKSGRRARRLRLGYVFGIGGENSRPRTPDGRGHGGERPVLARRRRQRERARSLARRAANVAHGCVEVARVPHCLERSIHGLDPSRVQGFLPCSARPGEAAPRRWLSTSVHMPSRHGHRNRRTYRTLGGFCSSDARREGCHGDINKSFARPIATPVPGGSHVRDRRIWRRGREIARHRALRGSARRATDQCSRRSFDPGAPRTGFPAPGQRQAIRTQKSAAKPHKEICGPARNRLARLGVD